MPVDRRAAIQLGLLLMAVPAQYLFTKFMSTTDSQRSYALRNLVNDASVFQEKYLSWKTWKRWCTDLLNSVSSLSESDDPSLDDPQGESPALEVLKYKDPEGHFAASTQPRSPRPPNVKYRIGQVIRHKIWGYRGVIVGWDPKCRAPADWIKQMHDKDKPEWRDMPNYSILVDTRDRLTPQLTYVPEENFEIITNMKIMHPGIDEYFEGFDGAQYLPRPWMKVVYPHD